MSRKITLEHCRSNSIGSQFYEVQVVETTVVEVDKAKELLATKGVNGFYWRVEAPDTGDQEDGRRYAEDCRALGIENVYRDVFDD